MKKIFLFPLNFKNKTEFLLEEIKKSNILENFIYITSNFCKVQDFKLRFYNKLSHYILPKTFTLKSFAVKIVNENSSKKVISEIEKYLIILELIKNKRDKNLYYTDEGFAKVISNFIKEVKISKIQISEIQKAIDNFIWKYQDNKKNIEFALRIFDEYENYLSRKNFIDNEDIYDEAIKYIKKYDFRNVVIENILEFPNNQKDFVSELIKTSDNILISFFNPEEFSPDTKELIVNETLKFLNSVENFEKEKVDGEIYYSKIECYNFPTKEEEIKGLINLINIEMINNRELNLNDFIITCPDMLNYRDYIKRVFSRFNIPIEIIPGYSFIFEPSVSPIFELFTLSESCDWNVLMNILTSPYFTVFDKKLVDKFSKETREKFENMGFYKDDFENMNDKNIKKIKECINLLNKKSEITLDEWKDILDKILTKMGWKPHKIEIKQDFLNLIKKLKGSYYLTKEEFINLIRKLLEMIEVEKGEGCGIRVSGTIESLGIERKICFFCGVTEENFPNSPQIEEFLIPDKIKKDLGLDYFEKRVARDRSDFYRIKNEHEKIIFTYPSKVEDKLQMKSIFIFDIDSKSTPLWDISFKEKELFKPVIHFSKFKKKYIKNNKLKIEVTELEKLLKCPYKFYLEKVENIKPYRTPKVQEVPKLWGEIIHISFQKTFEDKKNVFIENKDIKEYIDKFESLVYQEIENKYKEKQISTIYKKIMELRVNEILNKFNEIICKFSGNKFLNFEEEKKFKNDKILLKGRIDIVGKTSNGDFIIIDIKTGTGRNPSYTKSDFENNYNMQLPLYVWMYSKLNGLDYRRVKAEIWNFSFLEEREEVIKRYNFIDSEKFGYIEKFEEFLNKISEKIIKGEIFSISNFEKCEYYCEYKENCIFKNGK